MYQWELCETCSQRHCNKQPTIYKGTSVGITELDKYVCRKYRKHQEGFKIEEVVRYRGESRGESRTSILKTKGERNDCRRVRPSNEGGIR
jgi:hypothetical protein